jgi:hypothetical protein
VATFERSFDAASVVLLSSVALSALVACAMRLEVQLLAVVRSSCPITSDESHENRLRCNREAR